MKAALILLVLVALLGGGYFLVMKPATEVAPTNGDEMEQLETTTPAGESGAEEQTVESGAAMESGEIKEFTVRAKNFAYDVAEMRVKKGDRVKITLINDGGMHDWVVDEFNARTKQTQQGASDTVEFVADQNGEYEYYCSVGDHRARGMKGMLYVE